jgi:phospho-N-acetylmuramoyl-pentapeptide-transferase
MLHNLIYLSPYFTGFNVFQYVTFRAIGAALTALLIMFIVAPYVISILTKLKLGQPLRSKEEVHRLADLHDSKKGTPTMGGNWEIFIFGLH